MSTRILLIRHGDTPATQDHRFAGANNVPLSLEGRAHASQLATRLARYPIDAVYASSLQRAFDTAGFIAAVHNLPVTAVPELREMSHGVWDGKSLDEIKLSAPQDLAAYQNDPFTFAPEGGESGEMVFNRAMPALMNIVRAHPNQKVVVVAHKTTNRLLLAQCIGIHPRLYRDKLAQRPACLNVIEFWTEDNVQLLLLNDIGHYAMTPGDTFPYAV